MLTFTNFSSLPPFSALFYFTLSPVGHLFNFCLLLEERRIPPYVPSFPSSISCPTFTSLHFPLRLLTILTFIPSHLPLAFFLSPTFLAISPVFHHPIDWVYSFFFPPSPSLYILCISLSFLYLSFSFPAGCLRAVCHLMFL